jgi:hypothetical protein
MINQTATLIIAGIFMVIVSFMAGQRQGRWRSLKVMKRAKEALKEYGFLMHDFTGLAERNLMLTGFDELPGKGYKHLPGYEEIIAEIEDLEEERVR